MSGFDEVLSGRRSIRAFDPSRSVPISVLREVLELAQQAPSNCNAQPWRVFVAAGEHCERLRNRLYAAASNGAPVEEETTPAFVGGYRKLQIACAVELYRQIGVAREDISGRQRAAWRNFQFFDAPHVAVICMHRDFGLNVALDVGAYLQSFLLALQARGIGSCAQASLRSYANLIKSELGIPDELRVLCGVSFGYPVPDAPANRVHQARAPLSDNVVCLGFAEPL
jgi:hypothetical protein